MRDEQPRRGGVL